MRICLHCRAACEEADVLCPGCGADMARVEGAEVDPLVGRVLGRYRLAECVGVGAMSRVYRATRVDGEGEVAIKLLSPKDSADPVLVQRFQREARALGRLRHASNLRVIDFGNAEDGGFYLVTDLLRGRTLDTILRAEGALEPRRVVRLLAQALDGLTEAHGAGIVHRDLKPENLFVEEADGHGGERVRVIDYGIAKVAPELHEARLTASGSVCGTPDYMAPEQVRGDELDARADVYAAGVVLYEMLTGSRPFSGSLLHVLTMHMHHAPEPPGLRRLDLRIPPALEKVCLRAMAKHPDQRYPTAAAMRSELLAALPAPDDEEGDPAVPPEASPTPQAHSAASPSRPPSHSSRPAAAPVIPGFALPLAGRQRELQLLVETRRGSVLLLGPGGSGRTRIIEEWRRLLGERGERVVVMRADPSTARIPWRPVRRALAVALGMPERPSGADIDQATRERPADRIGLREVFGLGGLAAPEEREYRRREAMAAAVGILRDLGSAIACEDVDRYDRPSVEVVSEIMRDPGTGRVVATATSRGDLPVGATIELGPLSPADLKSLGFDLGAVEQMGIDPGRPQLPLAVESAHHAARELAEDGEARSRLAALLGTPRKVLAAAVVGGFEVGVEAVAVVSGVTEVQAPLSSLASRGLLRLEGDRVVLPSPTMRDALYAALSAEERARLHRAYAEILRAAHDEPVLVAHHAFAAQPEAVPLEPLERAMLSAERSFDDPGAVRWGIRALKRARKLEASGVREPPLRRPSTGPGIAGEAGRRPPVRLSPRVRTAVALGEALVREGDVQHAEPSFREAISAGGTEPIAFALAHRGLARVARARGLLEQAEHELEQAIARLPSPAYDEDAQVACELHLELAALRDEMGRPRDAETTLIQGAVRVPSAPEVGWRLFLALSERSLQGGRIDDARKLAMQALTAAEKATPVARARAHAALAAIEQTAGDRGVATLHRGAAVEQLRRAGDRRSIAELLLGSALAAGSEEAAPRGWLAEAGELARQVGWLEGVHRAHEALLQHD